MGSSTDPVLLRGGGCESSCCAAALLVGRRTHRPVARLLPRRRRHCERRSHFCDTAAAVTGSRPGRRTLSAMAFVYLLRCGDGTLYCGWTTDLGARVAAHGSGRGARYTRGRGPVALA